MSGICVFIIAVLLLFVTIHYHMNEEEQPCATGNAPTKGRTDVAV